MYSNELKEKLTQNKGRIHTKANKSLQDELNTVTSWCKDSEPNHMRVYCVLNNVTEYPMCDCGQNRLQYNVGDCNGFKQFCSRSCTAKKQQNSEYNKKRQANITPDERQKILDKQKQTMIEKYGVENYFMLPEFIANNYSKDLVEKRDAARVKNNLEKYGVDNTASLVLSKETLNCLNDREYMLKESSKKPINYMVHKLACDKGTIQRALKKHGITYKQKTQSTEEFILMDALAVAGITDYECSVKGLMDGAFEIDFYFPKHNFAIEINGLYWHSTNKIKDPMYHQNKFLALQEKGIKLLQLWDFEVRDNLDLVVSMIKHNINKSDKTLYARKCYVTKVDSKEAAYFITNNHMQAIQSKSIHYACGLYMDGLLVACMTFTKVGTVYTLQRYCNLMNHSVVGAFSKLLKYFTRNNEYSKVVTYSDARYSDGAVYANNGFVCDKVYKNKTTYYYTKDFEKLEPRWNYTRVLIQKKYPNTFDPKQTELQNMLNHGYTIIHGCCITRWVYS